MDEVHVDAMSAHDVQRTRVLQTASGAKNTEITSRCSEITIVAARFALFMKQPNHTIKDRATQACLFNKMTSKREVVLYDQLLEYNYASRKYSYRSIHQLIVL